MTSEWTLWSSCTVSCGRGIQVRRKFCHFGSCFDNQIETRICFVKKCYGKKFIQFNKHAKLRSILSNRKYFGKKLVVVVKLE
jgi:hypothetical protein